jgi:hypothetical protein
MTNEQRHSEEITVYDFDKLSLQTDCPAREVRLAIGKIVSTMIDDTEKLEYINLGVGELVKDVETHGDISNPRQVIIRREMGGIAIETINNIKDHSEHNGFGRLIIDRIFGNDYSASIDGDVYKGYLFIRRDIEIQLNSEVIEAF